ncbi:MAG: pyridoxamine 5-phosphate oxidase-related FMN-binding protein [Blastococcus sp.]|jgi:nitroimidazol reductase NimA-like FMN-containing flavoprotein (pyridoxamine 5'-phosphate oxidase superfamily)|nr:pyridoxamine 5-phosphate oxidase-related FMN-binding protein [Blastococcus sp.]
MITPRRERLLEVLDVVECRRLLAGADVGRIAFTEAALPAIQAASFVVRGEDVFIPTGPSSTLAVGSRGAVLAFEVDDYDVVERTGWNVTVVGPSRLVSGPDQVRELDELGVRPWSPSATHCYIALRMTVVRGQRISSTEALVDPYDAGSRELGGVTQAAVSGVPHDDRKAAPLAWHVRISDSERIE